MRKITFLFIFLITIALLVTPKTTIGRAIIVDNPNSTSNENLIVIFKEALSPQEALELLQGKEAQLISFNHSELMGDKVVKGGYFVSSQNPTVILEDYKISHLGFLQDIAREKDNELPNLDPVAKRAWERHLKAVETELASEVSFDNLQIESIIVSGSEEVIRYFTNLSVVAEVQKVPRENNQRLFQMLRKSSGSQLDYVNPSRWVPVQGSSYLYPSSVGGRYVQQNMYWNSWWNVSGFGANSTYEHDFFLNKYDNQTYLSSSQYPNGIPIVNYWSSNLPYPYLDTRLGDPANEKAYTIGSAYAVGIMPFQTYWYYIRTSNGNASTDNGKLYAQLGYRSPSWCYSTWCSYWDTSTPIQFLVTAWNIPAPGTYNWTH